MNAIHFGLSDIVVVLSILGGVIAILGYFDTRRKSAEQKAKEAAQELKDDILAGQALIKDDMDRSHTLLDHRLNFLEANDRHYVPKTDLEKEFEHEKRGRIEADNAAAKLIQQLRDDVTAQGKDIARLEQNDGYLANTINDLKASMKESFGKTDGKLDRVCDSLAALDKKVG